MNNVFSKGCAVSRAAPEDLSALVPLDRYLQSLGRSRSTFWRWQQKGLVKSVNVLGRNYITREEIKRFEDAAVSGTLAKDANPALKPSRASNETSR